MGVDDVADEVADERTDRRTLLRHAGAVAAGAAVGGAATVVTTAGPAAAAGPGSYDGNPAVTATGVGGHGVTATSDTNEAVLATVNNAFYAVKGVNPNTSGGGVAGRGGFYGVWGDNGNGAGAGVVGTSTIGYCLTAQPLDVTALAHLRLYAAPTMPAPPTRSDAHVTGEIALDGNQDLWLCVTNGTPGTWRRIAGSSTAGALTLLGTPVRVYDSRPGNPPLVGTKTPLANGAVRVVDTKAASSGVPVGATGVLANVTVVNTSASGFLSAYRAGATTPNASTVNWFVAGEIVANTTVVACDANAQISCYVPPGSSTDVFIDVIGYLR
ncbi:MAG: hypothetical protein U0Q07_12130 [Acidimicrobiales bacterium]